LIVLKPYGTIWTPIVLDRVTKRLPMSTNSVKQRVLDAIEKLPSDASVEDAIERLVFLAKIERGIAELDAGKGVSHAEAKQRLLQ